MEVTIKRRSQMPKPAKKPKAKAKPRDKWDENAKQRIIAHFKKDLSRSMGVKR